MRQATQARPPGQAEKPGSQRSRLLEGQRPWVLSPSDFAFLWDECPRCFYKKVVLRQPRPRMPFPKVFTLIDGAMKDFYIGERADVLAKGAPAGVIGSPDRWVKSEPISVLGSASRIVIRGRLDALVACDDGTTGVVDFKTAEPKADHVATYARQLHGYAAALELPSTGRPVAVGRLGLLCFSPDGYEASERRAAVLGDVAWVEVPRDDTAFSSFLAEVATVLEKGEPPEGSGDCVWCARGLPAAQ